MAKVHLVGVAATCYPHDLLHVPRHGDGGFPAPPPTPLGPGEEEQEVTTVVVG